MRRFFQTKAVVDTILKSVLSSIEFIVMIAETVKNMVDRAVDEYRPRDMEEHRRQLLTTSSQ